MKTIAFDFLTNHARVLAMIADDPTARMRDLAAAIGITERAVQRIVAELNLSGYLVIVRTGRRNQYDVMLNRPAPNALDNGRTVGRLIEAIRKDGAA